MDVIGLASLLAASLLFGYLAYRAVRARPRWMKLAGGIPAGLLALVCGAGLVLALVGYSRLNAVRANPVLQMRTAITPQLVANGERFARSCAGCHSADGQLPLAGHDLFGAGGPPIGTLWAPNLTPAHLAAWSDGEIVRAIREGVGRDGRTLLVMPSATFRNLSDEDVLALVAYLRSQPSAGEVSPPRQINAVGAILLVLAPEFLSVQPPLAEPIVAPPRSPTAAYGGYLVSIECQGCHGGNLTGGQSGPFPAPNLTTLPQRLSAEEFVALLRTGFFPDSTPIGPNMPIKYLEKMSEDDFRAIYAHLQQLGPQPGSK